MPRPPFPKNIRDFQRQFATDEACQDDLAACRWPDGFACPRCGHTRSYQLIEHRRWQCAACRCQVSLTAGTILHNTKTPLTVWFWATYVTVTDKGGHLGPAAAAATGAAAVRNGVDAVAQAAARDGERRA